MIVRPHATRGIECRSSLMDTDHGRSRNATVEREPGRNDSQRAGVMTFDVAALEVPGGSIAETLEHLGHTPLLVAHRVAAADDVVRAVRVRRGDVDDTAFGSELRGGD